MYDSNNVFAKILRGEIPSHKLHEDEHCLVILDIFPINPGHALVIPKVPVEDFSDLPEAVSSHVIRVGQKVAGVLRRLAATGGSLRCTGINFVVNDGPDAGQEIPHAHLHVIPRFDGDGFGFRYGNANRKAQPQDTLAGWALALKTALQERG